jgi:hypothetical protein
MESLKVHLKEKPTVVLMESWMGFPMVQQMELPKAKQTEHLTANLMEHPKVPQKDFLRALLMGSQTGSMKVLQKEHAKAQQKDFPMARLMV